MSSIGLLQQIGAEVWIITGTPITVYYSYNVRTLLHTVRLADEEEKTVASVSGYELEEVVILLEKAVRVIAEAYQRGEKVSLAVPSSTLRGDPHLGEFRGPRLSRRFDWVEVE